MKEIRIINKTAINEELQEIETELGNLIERRLYQRRKSFYYRVRQKDIAITKQPDLIRQLCRRAYLNSRKSRSRSGIFFVY